MVRSMPSLADHLKLSSATPEEQAARIRRFAKQIDVDVVTVRRYLSGTRRPSWDVLPKIAKATHGQVTADDFMSPQTVKKSRAA